VDNGICTVADTINVQSISLPDFSLGRDTAICEGESLSLIAFVPNAVYLWNDGNSSNQLAIQNAGLYWLDVNQQGCSNRDTLLVKVNPRPLIDIGKDTSICEGSSIVLNAFYPGASYLWQDKSTSSVLQVTREGNYSVSVVLNGCTVKESVAVGKLTKPDVRFMNDSILCMGMQLELRPSIENASLVWSDGSKGAVLIVKSPGTYYLTATNICGNQTKYITVEQGLCQVAMPNAFTPNSDGNNDIFRVPYSQFIRQVQFTVFNRFGQKVFDTNDPKMGWDGRFNGQDQPAGNYPYTLTVITNDGIKESFKGFVLLLR
jgi:gliding motility-associated-like protein